MTPLKGSFDLQRGCNPQVENDCLQAKVRTLRNVFQAEMCQVQRPWGLREGSWKQSPLGTQGHVKDQKMAPLPLALVPVLELQELTSRHPWRKHARVSMGAQGLSRCQVSRQRGERVGGRMSAGAWWTQRSESLASSATSQPGRTPGHRFQNDRDALKADCC